MERSGTFDYILLETTGLADPGNIAPLFWVDDGLGSTIYLDGIVTLVDAKNILRSLNETPSKDAPQEAHNTPDLTTAHLQISHADVVVVNKSDLVSPEQLTTVLERVQAINGLAKIHITQHGQVPELEGFLLDLHAYDTLGSFDVGEKGHRHLDPVRVEALSPLKNRTRLTYEQTIATVSIEVPLLSPKQLDAVDAWLRSILWESVLPTTPFSSSSQAFTTSFEIHRLKGRIHLDDGTVKMIQGVREVFEILDMKDAPAQNATRGNDKGGEGKTLHNETGKLVLIGRGIQELPWAINFLSSIQY